jgi:hypothetical protein
MLEDQLKSVNDDIDSLREDVEDNPDIVPDLSGVKEAMDEFESELKWFKEQAYKSQKAFADLEIVVAERGKRARSQADVEQNEKNGKTNKKPKRTLPEQHNSGRVQGDVTRNVFGSGPGRLKSIGRQINSGNARVVNSGL